MNHFSLANLQAPDGPQAAIEVKGNYYQLRELLPSLQGVSTRSLFATWDQSLPLLVRQAERVYAGDKDIRGIPPSAAHLLAPILYPDKMFAVGGNYTGHLREMGMEPKKWASMPFFLRPPTTTLVGPGNTVRIPTSTKEFDWECEVAAVMGRTLSLRRCSGISERLFSKLHPCRADERCLERIFNGVQLSCLSQFAGTVSAEPSQTR